MTPDLWYQILSLVITVVGTIAMAALNKYLKSKYTAEQLATARNIADQTVAYVEQVFTEVHGAEKLKPAVDAAKGLAAKAGINLTDEQWKTLIEAAVKQFNEWGTPVAPITITTHAPATPTT